MLGYRLDEIVGRPIFDFMSIRQGLARCPAQPQQTLSGRDSGCAVATVTLSARKLHRR
jgi:hypothetical protein